MSVISLMDWAGLLLMDINYVRCLEMSGVKIINDDAVIGINLELSGPELDRLAQTIKGKMCKIDGDEVYNFISGIIEASIIRNIDTDMDKREYMKANLLSAGKSQGYIESYMRGWDMVEASEIVK